MLLSSAKQALAKGLAKSLTPPEALSYSEWAKEHFRLAGNTAAPGRFKPWKFQRGILDAIGDPKIERVSVIKSARTGYTVSLVAGIGAFAYNDPCPVILLMPTEDDCRGVMADEVDPAFAESPILQNLMPQGRLSGKNSYLSRQFVGGGGLKVLAAGAVRNLRRHTARVLFIDEVDGMKMTVEGDPVRIAEKRTLSYADRKIVIGSTPIDEASSIILPKYNESDQRIFEIPCLECGAPFELLWEHVAWTAGKPETAHSVCPNCKSKIDERFKPEMVEGGEWLATRPEIESHAGFRLNALISLFANASWKKLAAEFETAQRAGDTDMQVFYNTVLGRVWSSAIEYTTEAQLMARRENLGIAWDGVLDIWRQDIPPEVMFMTMGVDVQHDRLECTMLGHTRDGVVVLGHYVIWGPTDLNSTWDELDSLVTTEFKHPLGGYLGFDATAVDASDGGRYDYVLNYCDRSRGENVYAVKGANGQRPVLKASKTSKRSATKPLFIVGVDVVKTELLVSLPRGKDELNHIRFSNSLDEEYFIQLTSERREVHYKQGRPEIQFVPVGGRKQEALDCMVYAQAIKRVMRFDWDKRLLKLKQQEPAGESLADLVSSLHT
jgi:phage terminase large subunit GpA-like protein